MIDVDLMNASGDKIQGHVYTGSDGVKVDIAELIRGATRLTKEECEREKERCAAGMSIEEMWTEIEQLCRSNKPSPAGRSN